MNILILIKDLVFNWNHIWMFHNFWANLFLIYFTTNIYFLIFAYVPGVWNSQQKQTLIYTRVQEDCCLTFFVSIRFQPQWWQFPLFFLDELVLPLLLPSTQEYRHVGVHDEDLNLPNLEGCKQISKIEVIKFATQTNIFLMKKKSKKLHWLLT